VPAVGLAAIDLDGTLLRADGSISDRNAAAIETAHELGVEIVLATGRPWVVARRTVAEIDARSFVITSNGALTVRPPDWEIFESHAMDTDDAVAFVQGAREALDGVGFAIEFGHGAYSEPGFAERLPPSVPTRPVVGDVLALVDEHGPIRAILAWHDDYDGRLAELGELLFHLVPHEGVELKQSGLPVVQFCPTGIDKALALATVAAELGVEQERVVAFGDELNDVGMLGWAGIGVAMGNAVDQALAAADEVTVTNEEDGVALVLERLLGR
jgi:hydroxymethylpyrimidine pyrophosphatase-like HAD family hydrolase